MTPVVLSAGLLAFVASLVPQAVGLILLLNKARFRCKLARLALASSLLGVLLSSIFGVHLIFRVIKGLTEHPYDIISYPLGLFGVFVGPAFFLLSLKYDRKLEFSINNLIRLAAFFGWTGISLVVLIFATEV